jgi:hypothetical protein
MMRAMLVPQQGETIMFRGALVLIGIVSAASASAEWPGQSMAMTQSAGSNLAENGMFSGVRETPTMRRQKLAQAIAVREEAARLKAADGGTLSAEHAAYIEKRVRKILRRTSATARTGSLVAAHVDGG